ncbi:MAG: DUF4870 domain-containing protein [Sulfolobales archaeon]
MSASEISEEEKIWGFIAWLLSIIGAVLALVLKPGYKYVRYWAYLSISFFILVVVIKVLTWILAFIPFIGWILSVLIGLALLIAWILGIVKSLNKEYWKPPIIYDIARMLGIERI